MDGERFDALARVIGRRSLLAGVATLIVGGNASAAEPACGDRPYATRCQRARQAALVGGTCDPAACAAGYGCCSGDGRFCCGPVGSGGFDCAKASRRHPERPGRIVAAGDCAPGQVICASRSGRCEGCLDPMTSRRHCGGCGNRCGAGAACVEGACVAAARGTAAARG